jgi:hypothetical protein
MFKFLFGNNQKKEPEKKVKLPQFMDLNHQPLKPGDLVESLRYNLGTCRIVESANGFAYESLETGETVSWVKMVDAATDLQKVKKVDLPLPE